MNNQTEPGEPMQTDEAYDDYYDAAKKDGEVIQGRYGGQIDIWVRANNRSPCGCRIGTCESKKNAVCRMSVEIANGGAL